MQVSQQDDFITHAVIGNQETVSMGVSDDAALMHILSSTLYTHPQLAVVREIICNAWDAHIAAGKTDTPVEITLTETQISIRDRGFGIAHASIGPIYGVYGNSTKREDGTVTGGFGLGSKAPFAYTDNFEVVSHHLGLKTVYRVSKSSMEKGGKPSINKIVSLPTDETGITVTFGLQKDDKGRFARLIDEVLQLGEIPATINGKPVELHLLMSQSPTGYLINDFRSTFNVPLKLRYGNVVYPIPEHDAYKDEYHKIYRAVNRLWNNTNVIFMAPPDSISIAPSREALILTDATIAVIKGLLTNFDSIPVSDLTMAVDQLARHSINKQAADATPEELLEMLKGSKTFDTQQTQSLVKDFRTFVTYKKAGTAMAVEKGAHIDSSVHAIRQLQQLLKAKLHNPHTLKQLIKIHRERVSTYKKRLSMKSLMARTVVYPLKQTLLQYPTLEKCRHIVYCNPGHYAGAVYKTHSDAFSSTSTLTMMLDRKALIARNAREAEIYLDNTYHRKNVSVFVLLVGSGKVAEQRTLDAIDMFTKLKYEVDMHLPEKVKVVKDPLDLTVAKPPVKRKKKGTYYSLAHSYCPDTSHFLLSRAREHYTDDTLIEEPVAWVILRSKGEDSRNLERQTKETSRYILKEWGTQIAVVTTAQSNVLKDKGVPNVTKFLRTYADEKLSSSPEFKRYAAFAHHAKDSYRSTDKVMYAMVHHAPLMESMNLRFTLSKDTAMLIRMCSDRYNYFEGYPKCEAVLKQVKCHPLFAKTREKIASSPVVDFVSLDCIASHLSEYDESDPRTVAVYELMQLLLK